ncbi:MAG: Calx-beta domain-containing protein [Casimicrobium sp.]
MRISTTARHFCAGIAASLIAATSFAQVISLPTTKVYASVGDVISVPVQYRAGDVANQGQGNFQLSFAANADLGSEALSGVYASCLFNNDFAGSRAVTWADIATSLFPNGASCGSQTATFNIATYGGSVVALPGGSTTLAITGATAGATTPVNFLVCGKTTVSSVSVTPDVFEGGAATFTVNFPAVATGCGGFAIPVTLSGAALAGKTAAISSNGCATIADGATSCAIGVTTQDNGTIDGNMLLTATVTDSTATSNYVSAGKFASLSINDNEVGASVAATTAAASETGPVNGVLTFTRTGATTATQALTSTITGTALPATGNFSFAGGSCAGVSYTAPTLSLTVPSGSASCTVNVIPVDDTAVEGSQTVIAGVPTGPSAVGTGSAATVTISDNDSDPVFGLVTIAACAEPSTGCAFALNRLSGVTSARTLTFAVTGTATRGTDYDLKSGTDCATGTVIPVATNSVVHNSAGGQTLNVCPIDDLLPEVGGETVILTLTTAGSVANALYTLDAATTSRTQTIADDDSPQVVTVSGGGAVAEAAGTGTFTYTRSGGSAVAQALALTVNIGRSGTATYGAACTAGVDYMSSVTGTTVTITGGQSTVDVTVTACDDALIDPAETVIYSVAAPAAPTDYSVGSPASATATITDDDVAVNAVSGATGSALSTSTAEGTIVRFSVSCPTLAESQQVDFAITPATAYPGDVYSGSPTGSVTCPAAAASLVAVPTTVQTINDTTIGNARTYTMTISLLPTTVPATNNGLKAGGPSVAATILGNAVATVNVTDDDQPVGVPTMSMLGLGFMSLMLAGFVAFQRRRVQK